MSTNANAIPTIRDLLNRSHGRCWYCGAQINPANFSRDHVIPKANGGQTRGNVVPACRTCNILKGAKSIETLRSILTRRKYVMPHFNAKQRNWLRREGFPIDNYPEHVFWFEEIGLTLPCESLRALANMEPHP